MGEIVKVTLPKFSTLSLAILFQSLKNTVLAHLQLKKGLKISTFWGITSFLKTSEPNKEFKITSQQTYIKLGFFQSLFKFELKVDSNLCF
jgi:hypothetical protein